MTKGRIGILTSGGDCSGLNAVIRAAYLRCKELGYELIGIMNGGRGMAIRPMDYVVFDDLVSDRFLLKRAGSIIKSNSKSILQYMSHGSTEVDVVKNMIGGYKDLGLKGLIYVGGDGSMTMLRDLIDMHEDFKVVAIPKTIDNDLSGTDFSVGFITATEVVANALFDISTTAASHDRVMIVEVMGREAGYIALYAGLAAGADVILVPEFKYDADKLLESIKKTHDKNGCCLVVVAEAVAKPEDTQGGVADSFAKFIKNKIGLDSRSVNLGHIQRGGDTSVIDRLIATSFGVRAVDMIDTDDFGKMLCYRMGQITSIPLERIADDLNRHITKNDYCLEVAKRIGVYIGEH